MTIEAIATRRTRVTQSRQLSTPAHAGVERCRRMVIPLQEKYDHLELASPRARLYPRVPIILSTAEYN